MRYYPLAMALLLSAPAGLSLASNANDTTAIRLAPGLERVLRDMPASGELTSLRQTVIAELMRRVQQGLPICEDDYACFEPSGESGGRTAIPAMP